MEKKIDIIIFGTFGNPYGFTQTIKSIYNKSNQNNRNSIKALDINTNAIKLFPNTEIYSIRKDIVSNSKSIALSKYSFVNEKNSTRGGTFIGSSLLFTNKLSDENIIIKLLKTFNNQLIQENTVDNIMIYDHSDKLSISKPPKFNELEKSSLSYEKLKNWSLNNKFLVHYCDFTNDNEFAEILKLSLELLNYYDCIYFTRDEEIAKYVLNKNLYELSRDNQDLQNKLQKIYLDIERKKTEILERTKSNVQLKLKNHIEKLQNIENEYNRINNIHLNNSKRVEKLKQEKNKFQNELSSLNNEMNKLLNELYNGHNVELVNGKILELETNFKEKTLHLAQNIYIESFSNKEEIYRGFESPKHSGDNSSKSRTYYEKPKSKYEIDLKKVLYFGFVFVGIIGIILLSINLITDDDNLSPEPDDYLLDGKTDKNFDEKILLPNSVLSIVDIKKTNDLIKSKKETDLNKIIDLIFEGNPKDIGSKFKNNRQEYIKSLLEKNPKSFDLDKKLIDTLEVIPCLKNEN